MIGGSLECPEFQLLLFVGLRALIDRLGAATFNVGIFNIGLAGSEAAPEGVAPLLARCCSTLTDAVMIVPLSQVNGESPHLGCAGLKRIALCEYAGVLTHK